MEYFISINNNNIIYLTILIDNQLPRYICNIDSKVYCKIYNLYSYIVYLNALQLH